MLRLTRARGVTLVVLSGRAWVTEEGQPADRFLAPGHRHRVAGDGLVLVSAERATRGDPGVKIALYGATGGAHGSPQAHAARR